MDLALCPEPTEPGTAVDRQTTERNANSSLDGNMKRIKTSRDTEIMLYNTEYLKNNYEKYIREDFLYAFGAFYCDKEMNIPLLDRVLKTKCYHPETELNYSHCEFATYMKNIVSWVDLKLNYLNGESSKCNKKTKFKTGYVKIGQQTTRISLNYKDLDSNTNSSEQNKKLKSVTNIQNEIIISPDITIPKLDFPVSATNNHKKVIDMVNNIQDEIISSPDITSSKHNIPGSLINDHNKEIYMVNSMQDEIITLSHKTSPKHDISRSSINDQETDIAMENAQTKVIISPKHNLAGSSTNDHKKIIDMVNNTQDGIITSPDITYPKHDIPGNSTNAQKTVIAMVNNMQDEIITSPHKTSPKHNISGSSINDQETDIAMENAKTKVIISPEIISPKHNLAGSSTNDHKKIIDNMVNNTQDEIIRSSDITYPKYDIPGNSTNAQKIAISMENMQSKIIPSPKHNFGRSLAKYRTKKINKINSNLGNILSTTESILSESHLKNPVISDNVKESTIENLKNHTNDKVVIEDEFCSAQTSFDTIIDEEIPNLCLKTSSTTARYTRGNKQTSKNLNKTSTTPLKRSNSVINSEHSSKKKKIEKPSSNVERKTTTNNDRNSVKTLNESIKQVIKNVYSRNSKGETKLHSACAKGKLNLVTSLLEDGFNPNVKDNAGWTPMHEAVKSGSLDIVQELIKYGAYLNVPGFEYESPLYTAIKYSKFEIAITLLNHGADANFINMYGNNARDLNEEKLSELLENQVSCISTQICLTNYALDEIVIVLNNVSLKSATVNTFCKQFNIKLVQNIMNEKQLAQVTHMIVPKTKNNTCDVSLECLIGIANGLFIINENWISDSLDKNKLVKCENYEVSGTQLFADCNGPNISRISKQKLNPKLFNGINIHVCGTIGWEQFSIEHLKKLVVEFGAKLLIRMPNPENCPTNIIPYHCRNNDQMLHVSNIILYTMDSNRLIKYNMKHLKAFHISWFMEAVQKYTI